MSATANIMKLTKLLEVWEIVRRWTLDMYSLLLLKATELTCSSQCQYLLTFFPRTLHAHAVAQLYRHTHTHTNMITNHRAKDRCMCVINSPAVRTQRAVCTVKFVKSFATWQHRFDVDSKFLSHPAPLSPVFENTYFTFFKIQKNAFFTFSWNDMSKKT